ncbi:MAG: class I SAM-dependent methyltransferase [Desulfuromonadaceae bacterium]|nr:class I SAM-dependent methyltransferase [Desulfuromonadaceae bacterium]
MLKEQMDSIYSTMPPEKIPWHIEEPPQLLKTLVGNGRVRPCRVVEFGCGAGCHALYLAGLGFEVTGIDFSAAAIAMAKKTAAERDLACEFLVADVLGDLHPIAGTYDFAYDWQLLHHIFPVDRKVYLGNVYRLLNRGASYLSVCFSEESGDFGGKGKYRTTPIGTLLYFSAEEEMRALFSTFFFIEELKTIEIEGKFGPHKMIWAFLKKE